MDERRAAQQVEILRRFYVDGYDENRSWGRFLLKNKRGFGLYLIPDPDAINSGLDELKQNEPFRVWSPEGFFALDYVQRIDRCEVTGMLKGIALKPASPIQRNSEQ